jgi:hypothetical protein
MVLQTTDRSAAIRPARTATRAAADGSDPAEGSAPVRPAPAPRADPDPLVVPVMSGAGGVGRSTVTAILAAALQHRTADRHGRVVAVCDPGPRSASPWPGWVDRAAARGTGWLTARAADSALSTREVTSAASELEVGDDDPVWVLSDTGGRAPGFCGAHPGPQFWAAALPLLRAAVVDSDALEAFRLERQRAGGELSVAAAWMNAPAVRTAAVWVTAPDPGALARTLEAITLAEDCGLSGRRFILVINDFSGRGWTPRSRSRRTLLADRVGAIVEMGYNPALRKDARPQYSARQLNGSEIADLVTAVRAVAR